MSELVKGWVRPGVAYRAGSRLPPGCYSPVRTHIHTRTQRYRQTDRQTDMHRQRVMNTRSDTRHLSQSQPRHATSQPITDQTREISANHSADTRHLNQSQRPSQTETENHCASPRSNCRQRRHHSLSVHVCLSVCLSVSLRACVYVCADRRITSWWKPTPRSVCDTWSHPPLH